MKKDLECLGRDAKKINALPATQRLLEKIREQTKSSPYALLGMHYVLLGSKHGGKFIAKICQEKYQFSDGLGVCYFDPYGPNFMPIWKSFREEMNQHQFEPEEIERICAAAATMFRAVTEIGDELMPLVKA